jgi:murein DD-endopeptidase MepM/ murein hydrolase activator NlpD
MARQRHLLAGLSVAVACSSPTSPSPPSYVNCALFPDSRTAPYVLPFPVGRRFSINRTFDHYLPEPPPRGNHGVGLYAIDINMDTGSPIHAIRAGTVVAVEERFSDNDHADYHENWVMIRHADNTIARYIHIRETGALVEVGDIVAQGQLVAQSGNSGASNGPHLHFDVQTCGPNLPPGYNDLPCGMTVPLSFRNTESHSCGLVSGRSYTSQPFTADSR